MIPIPPGHTLMVTDDGVRVHAECECGWYARRAAKKAANVAALRHALGVAPDGWPHIHRYRTELFARTRTELFNRSRRDT